MWFWIARRCTTPQVIWRYAAFWTCCFVFTSQLSWTMWWQRLREWSRVPCERKEGGQQTKNYQRSWTMRDMLTSVLHLQVAVSCYATRWGQTYTMELKIYKKLVHSVMLSQTPLSQTMTAQAMLSQTMLSQTMLSQTSLLKHSQHCWEQVVAGFLTTTSATWMRSQILTESMSYRRNLFSTNITLSVSQYCICISCAPGAWLCLQ